MKFRVLLTILMAITPPRAAAEPTVRLPVLEEFIFAPSEFTSGIVPRGLAPPRVAKFLSERLEDGTSAGAILQMELVADFYETTELAPTVRTALEQDVPAKVSGRSAPVRDVIRGAALARMLAKLGGAEDLEVAAKHYRALIPFAWVKEDFLALVQLKDELGRNEHSEPLRERLDARLAELEPQQADYASRLLYLSLKESVAQQLHRSDQAQAIKDEVLAEPVRSRRIEAELMMYLTLEYGFPEVLRPWSERRLRRESWAANPSEQQRRPDPAPLSADLAATVKAFASKLQKHPDVDKEDRDAYRLRLLRAAAFFGGKLTASELTFLKKNASQQADSLANEGFMIQKAAAPLSPYVLTLVAKPKQKITVKHDGGALVLELEGFGAPLRLHVNEGGVSACRAILDHRSVEAEVTLSLAIPDGRASCRTVPGSFSMTLRGREPLEEVAVKKQAGSDPELRDAVMRLIGTIVQER